MKEPEGKKKPKRPGRKNADASQTSPTVSYTPEQRRLIRSGLGIWARVAIRSYLHKHGRESQAETEEENES